MPGTVCDVHSNLEWDENFNHQLLSLQPVQVSNQVYMHTQKYELEKDFVYKMYIIET